jgi:hypothetical protein
MEELLEVTVPLEVYVTSSDDYVPLTGVHSVDSTISGWRWDRRILPSERMDRTRYLTYVGGHSSGLREGTTLEDWQSGNLNGCEYVDLTYKKHRERLQWVPQVKTGQYTVYWDERHLFSDYSFSLNLSSLVTENGGYAIQLPVQALADSVAATIFKRQEDFVILSAARYQRVDVLSGNDRFHEFTIDDSNKALFGDAFSIEVATDDLAAAFVADLWESKGAGVSDSRSLFGDYFPFEDGSVRLASLSGTGSVTLWEEKPNLNFSGPADKHFSVNYDLGVITTGGYKAPDMHLAQAMDSTSSDVLVFLDGDVLDSYPDQGVVQIGTEQILYTEKTYSGFSGLYRGYNSTVVADHEKGDLVEDIQHGASTTDELYISYRAVPRLEVEVSDSTIRTANKSLWVDVRPTANTVTNNILQILSADINLAQIVLEIDQPLIGGSLYGLLYYGVDTAKLTARALDSRGHPVEDVELTIYIVAGTGSLNGGNTEVTGITNSAGEIYAYYNSPYSDVETSLSVSSVSYSGDDTQIVVENLPTSTSVNDVWIFQVLKHDPTLGTVGERSTVITSGATVLPNGMGYVVLEGLFSEKFRDGLLYVACLDGVKRSYTINYLETYVDSGNDMTYTKVYLGEFPIAAQVANRACWLLTDEDIEWDPVLKRGPRVILYEWNSSVLHPVTGALGAYYPLHPDSISGTTITFKNRHLPIPAPTDDEENLGGYVVIAPGEVRFRAMGRDPYTGNLIYSNDIRARLTLPNMLTGVDSSGALPVPYGFRLSTEEFNIGTGVGGANFFTINPSASGINQFSLTGAF